MEEDIKSKHSSADHIESIEAADAKKIPDLDDLNDIPIGWFVWVVAVTASIAGMLFGYDTGIISAVLVYIHDALDGKELNESEKEMITCLCSAGAFFGAICAGLTADKVCACLLSYVSEPCIIHLTRNKTGRKGAIYLGCVLFTIGAVLQGASYTIAQMAVGRFVVGLGVGSAAMVVPLYVAELAPAKARGRLIGLNNTSITMGQVIAYALGAAFASVPHGWRYMVGLGGVPSIVLGFLLPWCPESPRHLVYKGRHEEAIQVLRRIYTQATDHQVDLVLDSIIEACEEAKRNNENETRWDKIKQLHSDPANLRSLFSACGLMVISQMSGFNTLMYYSSTLFSMVGFTNPTAVGLVVAAPNLIMTFVNMILVDKLGRRRLLLCTAWGMCAGMLAIAVAFAFIPVNLQTMEVPDSASMSPPAIVVLVFVLLFVIFYGVSVGNTAWMSADFFPLEVRSMGTMWMTCSNWVSNVIVSSSFLSMMKTMTPSGTFGYYAGICGLGWLWIFFFYPEVTGLPLEGIRGVFEKGYGRGMRRHR